MYYRPVNLSSEFRNAVEKLSNGRMELMFVPAGVTGRYQVNDTHLHKPLKDYARKLASLWYAARMKALNQMRNNETSSISTEDYQSRVSKLMSVVILRNKAPEWLWLAVQHISKKIPDEDRNLIKKGWEKKKGKLVMKQSRITSQYMTPWMDLIWTKTTQRSTLKKMSCEGWKRQFRQWNLHFMQGTFGLYGWIWFATDSIVCMTHCTCFVSFRVCTVKYT